MFRRDPWRPLLAEVGGALGRDVTDQVALARQALVHGGVIGVAGDTIVCCDDQGRLAVNGRPLEEDAYVRDADNVSLALPRRARDGAAACRK